MLRYKYRYISKIYSLLPFISLLAPCAGYAQASVVVGTVQDVGTKAAVPFAVVEIPTYHLGVQADQQGHFSLSLPSNLAPTDSLTVSALGYQRRRVALAAASHITLQPLPIALREVVVHGTKSAPVVLGPQKKAGWSSGFGESGLTADKRAGWQVAYFFAQPPTGQLTAVRFYVKRGNQRRCAAQLLQAPFRVRVYAADGPSGAPGTDLLTETVLAAASKPGWLTVSLTSFNLPTSAAGFFVAMEWLYTDARYLCQTTSVNHTTKERKAITHYGQQLGGYHQEQDQKAAWYLSAGYPWQQMPSFTAAGKLPLFSEPAIQAIIQP
ncbi:carboxypeptidase-like regulatory domain-containing protein [Hymenobacter aerilatus]|uniref:Carboxypeptidase-like regulatory domain-containing protein n=1 Tax=Hymenobacter aerilatus TaxID=2932251 RepID=A0A8T9SVL7_9BACT|nr:carboxypeptidase-like regulatory domain-containing protein [Hymenobacter aerilatus]UOR04763.1 carboxypeptidase-like regulatory domain-containing protein [Hymenobacter aerilatus]